MLSSTAMKQFQIVLLILCGLLSGCTSTYQTFISEENTTNDSYGNENYIYVGTRKDLQIIPHCFDSGAFAIFVCPYSAYSLIDLPFSFVSDSIFLFYTIPLTDQNNLKLKEAKREQGLVVEFVMNNSEILRATNGIKRINAIPHRTTELKVMPNRYEAIIVGNDEKSIYAIVRVSDVSSDAKYSLECITRLSWGNRQTRKDVCEQ
jgi:uncharacterized protein YceK